MADDSGPRETQLTRGARNHILTNIGVWSFDGRWIVYDTRSDPAGDLFDGSTIERVNVSSGEVQILYRSNRGSHCGVATCSPVDERVIFILGPHDPTPDWQYGPTHRQGVIVDPAKPQSITALDARDMVPPFTVGALRGGSHVHVFSADGQWVSFTYEDEVLARLDQATPSGNHDRNQRNIGVSIPARPVAVNAAHARNHSGQYFSVLVTRTASQPAHGSDEISRAFEEGWVGTHGYERRDGTQQSWAIAFQGHVITASGQTIAEAFIVDLPDDLTIPGDGPLQGTETRAPFPPKGTQQRRLTFTAGRKYPGLQGPRHWLRSAPDGSRIALLMKDDAGIVQLWTVSPLGGSPLQITHNEHSVASAFTWHPSGRWIGHAMDGSICVTEVDTGVTRRLTPRQPEPDAPRPEACVFSPTGSHLAYVRPVLSGGKRYNQIFSVPTGP